MSTEGKIALSCLIAFAIWLFLVLPAFYSPGGLHVPEEMLGVKPGEWLLSIATAALGWTTWKLVKGADRNADRQLRAYVYITSPKITNLTSGVADISISIPIRNAGQTPAYKLSLRADVDSSDFPTAASDFDLPPTPSISNLTIGPSSNHLYEFTISPLSAAELGQLQAGTTALYVHGEIRYIDAFDAPRRTRFCLVKGGGFGVAGDDLFLSSDGNESN